MDSDNGFQQTDSYVAFPDEALEAGLYRIPTVVGNYVFCFRIVLLVDANKSEVAEGILTDRNNLSVVLSEVL